MLIHTVVRKHAPHCLKPSAFNVLSFIDHHSVVFIAADLQSETGTYHSI